MKTLILLLIASISSYSHASQITIKDPNIEITEDAVIVEGTIKDPQTGKSVYYQRSFIVRKQKDKKDSKGKVIVETPAYKTVKKGILKDLKNINNKEFLVLNPYAFESFLNSSSVKSYAKKISAHLNVTGYKSPTMPVAHTLELPEVATVNLDLDVISLGMFQKDDHHYKAENNHRTILPFLAHMYSEQDILWDEKEISSRSNHKDHLSQRGHYNKNRKQINRTIN